jgi:S1-C subfamily serine protease
MLEPQDRSPEVKPGKSKVGNVLSLLVLSAIASCSVGYLAAKNQDPTQVAPAVANSDLAANTIGSVNTNFITQVVDRTGPAVVRINSTKRVSSRQLLPDEFMENPRLRQFFGEEGGGGDREIDRGTGSGFIINANGQIMTNAHVISGADKVKVTLKDGREFDGKVLGLDKVTDVAVIKIEANNLPTIPLGNSDNLKPGEWAIAIGNPLGLDNTVTTGIISATGRSSSQIGAYDKRVNYIQTDAAINPGNSGGPLLNASGQAIGMNTAILRNSQGLGFAIPINTAQRIATKLIATGKFEHPFLGIQMMSITPKLRQELNNDPNSKIKINSDKGVVVANVLKQSPAAIAGMKVGDEILAINGQAVQTPDRVRQSIDNTQIGGNVKVQIRRNGQTIDLNVSPTAAPQTR